MKKIPNKGKVKFKKGYVFHEDGSDFGKNVSTLQEALHIESQCGVGFDSCLGMQTYPLRDSTTGLIIGYVGMYFTTSDGGTTITTVVEPIDTARANIAALKALS